MTGLWFAFTSQMRQGRDSAYPLVKNVRCRVYPIAVGRQMHYASKIRSRSMLNDGRAKWVQLLWGCVVCAFWGFVAPAKAQFVAFNDYAPGGGTHPNATTYGPGGSGKLKDITTGATGTANLLVYSSAITDGVLQGSPGYGTPAFIVFDGYVDLLGDP